MNKSLMFRLFLCGSLGLFLPTPSYALDGTDVTPGTACSTEDAVMMTVNPGGSGGHILTCESSVWVAQMNAATPTANAQVATKEYVDTALAAGSSYFVLCASPTLCPNVGDVCDDGDAGTSNDPIFAGCANYGGTYEPLFVTDDNQSTSSRWKTSTGANDIATDHYDDGKLNVAQITVSTTFPAFKLCDDLTDGGFTDWYLPARSELDVLWQNLTAINANAAGNLTASRYWSSTESSSLNAWGEDIWSGRISTGLKNTRLSVRCVRRN